MSREAQWEIFVKKNEEERVPKNWMPCFKKKTFQQNQNAFQNGMVRNAFYRLFHPIRSQKTQSSGTN